MSDATLTIRLDAELKAVFIEAAKNNDRTAAQLLRDFMRDYISRHSDQLAHEAWIEDEIKKAVREADNPNSARVSHDEVQSDWRRSRAALIKRVEQKGDETT